MIKFQSTLPTRGSDIYSYVPHFALGVSIHAPHEGERHFATAPCVRPSKVSIHAPHEGERHVRPPNRGRLSTFQSTLPTRGSDSSFTASSNDIKVSIHAPHEGERRVCPCACINSSTVSIHAPHEGERLSAISIDSAAASGFNPRSPRGGATCFLCRCFLRQKFQSTLPTRGSDYQSARRRVRQRRFNPRSPRGGATTISPHGDMI